MNRTDTLADLTFLNRLKHQIRAVTKALDTTQHVFGQSLEARSIKHEVMILLSELKVHGLLPEQVTLHTNARSDPSLIVEMTYIGQYTQTHLRMVQQGQETLATLKRRRRLLHTKEGDIPLSLDEAISLLERREGIEMAPEELQSEMAVYQKGIESIEREPDAYVLPEIAHDWYKQQIERISQQLQAIQAEKSLSEVSL